MNPFKITIYIIFISNVSLIAQKISILETEKLQIEFELTPSNPKFSADDAQIIFTSPNFKGLYKHDLLTGEIETISGEMGAGYNPRILDNNIYYKTFDLINGRKFYSIKEYSLNSGKVNNIESNMRAAKIPFQRSWNDLIYLINSDIKKLPNLQQLSKRGEYSMAVYSEDKDLILINNNEKIFLNPLGKGVYVWESISPDGKFILFSFGNQGAFLSDLTGAIILNIEGAHYPRFSPNGRFISFMKDRDDGYNYIESDIFIYSLEDEESYKVSNTEDRIEMYPEWSNDGNRLVYQTTDGEIYISKLNFEN